MNKQDIIDANPLIMLKYQSHLCSSILTDSIISLLGDSLKITFESSIAFLAKPTDRKSVV